MKKREYKFFIWLLKINGSKFSHLLKSFQYFNMYKECFVIHDQICNFKGTDYKTDTKIQLLFFKSLKPS